MFPFHLLQVPGQGWVYSELIPSSSLLQSHSSQASKETIIFYLKDYLF